MVAPGAPQATEEAAAEQQIEDSPGLPMDLSPSQQ
jgi:hypothetical protein